MAYVTFQQVADKVGGVKRLVETVMNGHADEDANDHPYFDEIAAVADREADIALARGGYETPLDAVTDPKLRDSIMGIIIGLLSETSSQQEEWMVNGLTSGRAYLDMIASSGITVIGAEPIPQDASGGIFGSFPETPLFDLADPWSGINDVSPPLPGGFSRRWR